MRIEIQRTKPENIEDIGKFLSDMLRAQGLKLQDISKARYDAISNGISPEEIEICIPKLSMKLFGCSVRFLDSDEAYVKSVQSFNLEDLK